MKINVTLMKLTIRLLLLMLLFVMLFLISTFLYSVRYWPDVYNYVNANITITRIPTISELNLTVIEVVEYNTELYSTPDMDYFSTSEFDTNTEEYTFTFEDFDFPKAKVRRNAELEGMGNDYSDVPKKSVLIDYFFVDEDGSSTRIMKDSVDESKLTTRDLTEVEIMNETQKFFGYPKMTIGSCGGDKMVLSEAVFPWVAAIYLKNNSNGNQFDYICDGALISDNVVLTAARCVSNGSDTLNTENFLIILGKTSLQASRDGEQILKVKAVQPHENFTTREDKAINDLALLILEDSVKSDNSIAAACFQNDEDSISEEDDIKEAITTAWSLSGDLTLIYFDKEKSKACGQDNKVENTFCATYRNDVALCPSYGGLYVTLTGDNQVYLQGLRSGNPLDRGVCFTKDVNYTSLRNYRHWIQDIVDDNK